ncbi:hypothetical protein AYI70_g1709 [Smittium culicis]|uniref:C2 domain-containing protein n=1 Tax=Smittium culicis TaxID=133412 RepID=A0A1R1YBI8_9FUNG|nr:hypothetical protein AYI70_g1709 [Smittium culicis]
MDNPPEGKLEAFVISAKDLPVIDRFSKKDTYVELTIDNSKKKTLIDHKGGSNPKWSDRLAFNISGLGKQSLLIQVKESGKMSGDEICSGFVDLRKVYEEEELDGWYPLTKKNKPAGSIYIEFTFTPKEGRKKKSIIHQIKSLSIVPPVEPPKPSAAPSSLATAPVTTEFFNQLNASTDHSNNTRKSKAQFLNVNSNSTIDTFTKVSIPAQNLPISNTSQFPISKKPESQNLYNNAENRPSTSIEVPDYASQYALANGKKPLPRKPVFNSFAQESSSFHSQNQNVNLFYPQNLPTSNDNLQIDHNSSRFGNSASNKFLNSPNFKQPANPILYSTNYSDGTNFISNKLSNLDLSTNSNEPLNNMRFANNHQNFYNQPQNIQPNISSFNNTLGSNSNYLSEDHPNFNNNQVQSSYFSNQLVENMGYNHHQEIIIQNQYYPNDDDLPSRPLPIPPNQSQNLINDQIYYNISTKNPSPPLRPLPLPPNSHNRRSSYASFSDHNNTASNRIYNSNSRTSLNENSIYQNKNYSSTDAENSPFVVVDYSNSLNINSVYNHNSQLGVNSRRSSGTYAIENQPPIPLNFKMFEPSAPQLLSTSYYNDSEPEVFYDVEYTDLNGLNNKQRNMYSKPSSQSSGSKRNSGLVLQNFDYENQISKSYDTSQIHYNNQNFANQQAYSTNKLQREGNYIDINNREYSAYLSSNPDYLNQIITDLNTFDFSRIGGGSSGSRLSQYYQSEPFNGSIINQKPPLQTISGYSNTNDRRKY